MEIAGYIASIFIGISLGLIGGGGSILTVPVLVYLFKEDPVLATTYSLFIVGLSSTVGSFTYFKKGLINFKTALVFGIPSVAAVFLTRAFVLPAIPAELFELGNFVITKSIFLMFLFALLMVMASYSMIKKKKTRDEEVLRLHNFNFPLVFLQGIFVGFITGLIGAGGGFLIIPALVNLLKLTMKTAVGTSLFIISINSLTGFIFSLSATVINWPFLLTIAAIAVTGIFIGTYLSTKIEGKKLKVAFGWFVLVMGIYILIKESLLR